MLINTYNEDVTLQHNQLKADQFYYQRKMQFTWKLFKNGIKYSKLEDMCDGIYTSKLKAKVLNRFISNIKINQKKAKLNQLMTNFVKHRSLYLIKHTYFSWRHHYELETYYSKAINEFKQYRQK